MRDLEVLNGDVPGSSVREASVMMDNNEELVPAVPNCDDCIVERLHCRSRRHIRKKISLVYLFKNICASRNACLDWLKNRGLIPRIMFCPTCQRKMKFEANENCRDGFVWICKECPGRQPVFSARHGSWLEGWDAPLVDILLFTYLWTNGCTPQQIAYEVNMPITAVNDWSVSFTNICASVYEKRVAGEGELETENDLERKNSHAAMWRRKNKHKDPFIEFLKDADSL